MHLLSYVRSFEPSAGELIQSLADAPGVFDCFVCRLYISLNFKSMGTRHLQTKKEKSQSVRKCFTPAPPEPGEVWADL